MDYLSQRSLIVQHFTNSLAQAENEHQAVDSSARSHAKRFRKIAEVGPLRGTSILDVGCALGGFYAWLRDHHVDCDYTGYDVTESMIVKARANYPEIANRFLVRDILEGDQPREAFDYVLAISPLNLPMEGRLNVETTVRLVDRMLQMCRVGVGICMTSSLTLKPGSETYYYDPAEMLGRTTALCRNVRLDHTYLPHDFAIFCYKRDLYDA